MRKIYLNLIRIFLISSILTVPVFGFDCGNGTCDQDESVWTCCMDCGLPAPGCNGSVSYWYVCPSGYGNIPERLENNCTQYTTTYGECGIQYWHCELAPSQQSHCTQDTNIIKNDVLCPDYCSLTNPSVKLDGNCTDTFLCNWVSYNCNTHDGNYCLGNSLENRDYSCSAGSCEYNPIGITDCGLDIWTGGGNTPGFGQDDECVYTDYFCVDQGGVTDYCDSDQPYSEDFDYMDNPFACFEHFSGQTDYWCDLATCDSVDPLNGCSPDSEDFINGCDPACGAECSVAADCGQDEWVCVDEDTIGYEVFECTDCFCGSEYTQQEDCQDDYIDNETYYCEQETYSSHQLNHDFYCSGGGCMESTGWVNEQQIQDCNIQDGWYIVGDPYYDQGLLCQDKEYRDYYCDPGLVCPYDVTNTDRDCEATGDQIPRICVDHRNVIIGTEANLAGVNPFDYRTSSYAFSGEQIEFTIVVRDFNGALDIGLPRLAVEDGEFVMPEALCNEISLANISEENCDGLGMVNAGTDKAFHCLLTVEPMWQNEMNVKIITYNSFFLPTEATHEETWFFNPALSLSVETSDGMPIHFEEMPYMADTPEERTVHSLNRLQVQNTAEGGVNMWMYLAGTGLFDPIGASKCPITNVLAIEDYMWYRGWTGTQWTSWEGWEKMGKYDQNEDCVVELSGPGHCYGGKPVPYPNTIDQLPDPFEYVLTNQGKLEVEFKLQYPIPCVGSFSQGSLLIFGKAI